jgi:hypothetical protein
MKRNGWQLLQGFQREDIRERIQHVRILLSWGPATSCQEVAFRIHVADAACMSFKHFDDREGSGVENVYASSFGRCAKILAGTLHNGVLGIDWKLDCVSIPSPVIQCGPTVSTIVPFSTSNLNICSWHPAIKISRVPLEVKFMHFRSLKSGFLRATDQHALWCGSPQRLLCLQRTSDAIVSDRGGASSEHSVWIWRARPCQ